MPPDIQLPIEVVASIESARASRGRAIIAIDGRGGAGKSSLARALVTAIPGATHVEYDWFHLPRADVSTDRRFDDARLIRQVLQPFLAGESGVVFQRYNWGYLSGADDGFHPDPVRLVFGSVLVIEGCETLRGAFQSLCDVRIWLDTSLEESFRRGVRRDIDEYGLDPERVRSVWEEWAKWEAAHGVIEERRKKADFVL